MPPPPNTIERSLHRLIKDYQQLNPRSILALDHTPSPLEFHRFVADNRPLVVRGEGRRRQLPALDKWTDEYLIERMAGLTVEVAVSPEGNADSVISHEGTDYFVEPASAFLSFDELFDLLTLPQTAVVPSSHSATEAVDGTAQAPVYYLQSQNGNLGGELEPLVADVGTDGPAWASEVFGQPAEVANVWIGDSRSVTSLHKDPYENIYTVIRGSKTFILYPPTEFYCLHEQIYPSASFAFTPPASFTLTPSNPTLHTPWIPLDPLSPSPLHTRHSLARPYTVTLNPGDSLYLPALWFHHVSQRAGPGPTAADRELVIAVNWWSDMRMEGHLWAATQLVRRLTLSLDGREEPSFDSDSDGGSE